MPKKPQFESVIHSFLLRARHLANIERVLSPSTYPLWERWINSMDFTYVDPHTVSIAWTFPNKKTFRFSTDNLALYVRGDMPVYKKQQREFQSQGDPDKIKEKNDLELFHIIKSAARIAEIPVSRDNTYAVSQKKWIFKHFLDEERLFDKWANEVDVNSIDVYAVNEAVTAPEMRFILSQMGDLRGKKILDVGCGLGEASAYFALKGARVTVVDLSQEMLETAKKLARKYKVTLSAYQSAVEHLTIPKNSKFDIIYAGNLFHHVDIAQSLAELTPHLKKDGILICWEPVDYNPIINIYRRIARRVRSSDERPIRLDDMKIFRKYFRHVETKWFWFTTLVIFLIMILIERRDPNKERLWKSVVRESRRWAWLYKPLEQIDRVLLSVFPGLGRFCWNVVIIGTR